MPKSEVSQEDQVVQLKQMLADSERINEQMRIIIADLEAKTKNSKDKKRNN